ncbi:PREDICTED: cysteine proteinase inhibitor B-like [Lupinus angustifolius]|nr:PREDICTED: cysteine proteinase inhibitor B-like [Lupinus angustifolius]
MMANMLITLTTLITLLSILSTQSCGRVLVGGKMEISEVKTNMQVQELGKFSVEEYNKGIIMRLNGGDGEEELKFVEVMKAQYQVVAGLKYYLEISAMQNGIHKVFNSIVVVKPWLHSKNLLNFGPLSSNFE